ncbi:diguanylate cyclase, partial [Blautia wexlerae]|uniref:GGDEF domain-containing protein n=1 Tax=Blautia wexlerae TaxID=418240 RepID=UPI001D01A5B1
DDEFFPQRIVEESNAQLKKEIAEKTKELEMSNQQVIYNLRRDYLTGILNRPSLEKEVTEAMSNHQYGVILVLDIDYFKEVNDNNGHP